MWLIKRGSRGLGWLHGDMYQRSTSGSTIKGSLGVQEDENCLLETKGLKQQSFSTPLGRYVSWISSRVNRIKPGSKWWSRGAITNGKFCAKNRGFVDLGLRYHLNACHLPKFDSYNQILQLKSLNYKDALFNPLQMFTLSTGFQPVLINTIHRAHALYQAHLSSCSRARCVVSPLGRRMGTLSQYSGCSLHWLAHNFW